MCRCVLLNGHQWAMVVVHGKNTAIHRLYCLKLLALFIQYDGSYSGMYLTLFVFLD